MENNDLVRYSRAGDAFHYRWAARRCLRMIHPKSSVNCIVIEGSKENDVAGEYAIDVTEYTGDDESDRKQITYFQLKHSIQRVDEDLALSGLKETIEKFAERFSALKRSQKSENVKFSIITNRVFADSLRNGITAIRCGNRTTDRFQSTIEKYTQLKGNELKEFCSSLELVDNEGDFATQRYELHAEISEFLVDIVEDVQIDSIITLVSEKALPGNEGQIIPEDILKRFGVTSKRDLFPAPLELEKNKNFIKREQHESLLNSVLKNSTPFILHASGGVGKSVFARQLSESLPDGSLGIVYDCFGSGQYRNPCKLRHRHRDALVQIANEIALHGLCEIVISRSTDLDDAILRAFLSRLEVATAALRKINQDAILAILIDAADNAEMAAQEFNDSCFAHQLLRTEVPEGCRIIALCRTERIELLKPRNKVRQIELKPFSQTETLVHFREHFPSVTDIDGLEFHRLTSGNPRVQANALSLQQNTVSEVLASLEPSGTTVEKQIAAQLESSISRVKDKLPNEFKKPIKAICFGLANLTPFIPIEVLANAAEVERATVVSFVADLGRPLWISENSVQFRDEPTETWFRKKFSASVQQIESYLVRLKPLASKFSYVAQVLPSLLLQSENYDELISLALSDDYLPQNSPIDERNIRVYRLQFAFKAALKQKRYADAAKLALRAGEEVAGNKRQLEILTQNVDLIAPLQSPQRVQELAFRRMLRGDWEGSENVYSAALLSSIEEFKGEARGFLRSARNWLNLYFEERKKHQEKRFYDDKLKENDIVEMAFAHFNLHGSKKLVDFILDWKPPVVIFRVARLFIRRLVDTANFVAIDEISQLGCRSPYIIIAIADELITVGKFPPRNVVQNCLDLLIHKRIRISKPTDYGREYEQTLLKAIISFAEVSSALKLSQTKIMRILNYYLPHRAFYPISDRHCKNARNIFLRGTALRVLILDNLDLDLETLIPQWLSEEKERNEEKEEFKQVVGGLLPWYSVRSRILLDRVENLETAFQEANELSKNARSHRYKQNDYFPREIAWICFESIALKNIYSNSEKVNIIENLFNSEYQLSFRDRLSAVRTAYRLDHLAEIRNQLEQSCYEIVKSSSDERPEDKAEYYIKLARAVLPVSPADAAAYFDYAIEVVSKFGDELVERWNAIVAIAKRFAETKRSSPELAYRFIRCAEVVGDSTDDEHWNRNEAIRVCAKLCSSSALAALSRWRDRDVGWLTSQLPILADELVRSQAIEPSVGWSLSAFSWEYQFDKFVALCIETESSKNRRQYILDMAVRDLRLNDVSEDSWQNIARVAQQFSLKNEEIQQVLDFYAKQPQSNETEESESPYRRNAREESQNFDWQVIFNDLDLTKSSELGIAIKRFYDSPFPHYHKTFWQEVFKRVSENKASELLSAIAYAEQANFYDVQSALSCFPDNYRQKVSVKRCWNHILSAIAMRFASQLTSSYLRESFFEIIHVEDSVIPSIYQGIVKGLSESSDLVSADPFFGFSEIISSLISPQEAGNLLEFAIERFEIHIEPDYGDGSWDNWLHPPDDILDAFSGFIWASLGSPRSVERWQAAHCVRRLAEADCEEAIDALIEWMNRDCVNAFGSQKFPFYNLHARLYLLIASARVAIDYPEKLRRHHSIFAHHALDSLPHILIQKFSAQIALSIEANCPGMYSSSVREKLSQVGISQMPVREIDRYKETLKTPWYMGEEVNRDFKFQFAWDFDRYWLDPLGDVFGISVNQIKKLAHEIVFKEWDGTIKNDFKKDPRYSLWNSYSNERETWHSHGESPRTDDYSFYRSYHVMFGIAAKLLLEMPIVHYNNDWHDNRWTDWLQGHILTRSDGRWLADRRDPAPLIRRAWLREQTTEVWKQNISSDDFLDGLAIEHNDETWLNVCGSWSDSDRTREENFYVMSALVSKETSQALLNALSTCLHPYDFKLPSYQEENMEFTETPFELQGWIWRETQDNLLDASDPHADKINYPPYRIGQSIIKRLALSVDLEQRKWFMLNAKRESLTCQIWSLSEGRYNDDPTCSGIRMSASLEFLKKLCSTLDRQIIIEVQIQRRFHGYSYYTRNDDKGYSDPLSKIYILSADGQLRDTRTCYQLR